MNDQKSTASSWAAFQQAVDLNLLMSVTDENGIFKSVNKNFTSVSQYSEEELIGKSFRILHTGDPDAFFEQMWDSIQQNGGWKGEIKHKAKDGSFFWVEKVIVPVKDSNGNIHELFSIASLITDKKEAELALLKSKERIEALFDAIPEMISISTPQGKRSYINSNFCDFFGKSPQELIDINYTFGDQQTIEEYVQQVRSISPTNPNITNLIQLKNYHGEDRWILWSETGIFDKEGKTTEVLSLGKDVTRMKEAQDEINNQRKFTESILNNIPADIAVFDAQHVYVFINRKALANDGMRNWLLGKTDFDYCALKGLDTTQAERRHEYFNKAISTRQQIEWVDEHVTKTGSKKYVLRKFSPYFENDKIKYVIGYGIDVTSIKIADEQKDAYIKQLEELAFATSHKVRHPLANLQGLIPLLEDDTLQPEERAKILQYIKDSAKLLDEFTRELSSDLSQYKQALSVKE